MSAADQLAGVPLPPLVRDHALKHLERLERAEDAAPYGWPWSGPRTTPKAWRRYGH